MTYDEEIRHLVERANDGDYTAGEHLLNLFSTLAEAPEHPHPILTQHIARCIAELLSITPDKRRNHFTKAFRIARSNGRPTSLAPNTAHVQAIKTFLLARKDGLTYEQAIERGATAGHMSTERMHDLIRKAKKTRQALNEEMSALAEITRDMRSKLQGE